ncbi:hypothetical protein N0V82_008708 [Gnomoniopsis sp. IMI 355080]|nr:hypothetical protein N0V82_008708 [Gnomoniopsis sp. IMI 355080]
MSQPGCIAVVTGANRLNGVGLACVRQLAFQYPSSKFNRGPLLIYLTSRNKESGEAAVQAVTQQIQEASAKDSPPVEVKLRLLDIESPESISALAASLAADHPKHDGGGGIDILINNAAVLGIMGEEGLKPEAVEWTIRANYYGVLRVMEALLPQIREGGRIVNLGSLAGGLKLGPRKNYSDGIEARFLGAEKVEDVNSIVEDFAAALQKGEWQKDWPPSAYAVSKAAVVAITRVFAKQLAQDGRQVLVNCCCPGMVMTDMYRAPTGMTGMSAIFGDPKTPDQGAKTPVMLALDDLNGQSGLFWRNEKILEWK